MYFIPGLSQENIKGELAFYANTTFSNSGNRHAAVKYFSLSTNMNIMCPSAHGNHLSCITKYAPVFLTHITSTLHNQTCSTVQTGNFQLLQENEVKYLDMHLDRRLTWAQHIKTIRKQLNL
jgi:hypothetical protein